MAFSVAPTLGMARVMSVPRRHFALQRRLAVALGNLRAQLAQGGQMQVNGPRTELAAAG